MQEFEGQPMPSTFGTDVVKTSACGQLQAKYVYHAAVRKYRDSTSKKVCSVVTGTLCYLCFDIQNDLSVAPAFSQRQLCN